MGTGLWWDPPTRLEYPMVPPLAEVTSQVSGLRLRPTAFPATGWSADFRSLLVLAEFAGQQPDWREEIKLDPPPDDQTTEHEIQYLIGLAQTQRAARIPEIVEQYSGFRQYLVHLLAAGPDCRPATYLLLKIGSRIGELVMTYFKNKFNRPRPSQCCPALLPPTDFGGLASYPGGHALVGHLMALSVGAAVPDVQEAMQALADRIANNMEIGGFHFPSDTTSGRKAAGAAFELLKKCDGFAEAVAAARPEW